MKSKPSIPQMSLLQEAGDQEKRANEYMLDLDVAQRELASTIASLNALALANEAKRQEIIALRLMVRDLLTACRLTLKCGLGVVTEGSLRLAVNKAKAL